MMPHSIGILRTFPTIPLFAFQKRFRIMFANQKVMTFACSTTNLVSLIFIALDHIFENALCISTSAELNFGTSCVCEAVNSGTFAIVNSTGKVGARATRQFKN